MLESLATKHLNHAPNDLQLIKRHYDTQDIVELVVAAHEMNDEDSLSFAKELRATNRNDLYNIWKLVNQNVKYVADKRGYEVVKSPNWLWRNRAIGGDCKSFTNFIASILKHRVHGVTRFAGYEGQKTYTHVYPVIFLNGREIIMDATIKDFDREIPYAFKVDYDWNTSRLNGAVGMPPDGWTWYQWALLIFGGLWLFKWLINKNQK